MISLDNRSSETLVRYWATRAIELAQSIEDTSLDESIARVQSDMELLKQDRRVLVAGERGSGKSSILAGLAGLPLLAKFALDEPYVRWRYSCRDGDASHSRFIVEPAMRGIELVDTQPLELPEQLDVVKDLARGADVLLCVLNARSPQSDLLWGLMESLPNDWLGHCLLVVTHSDSLSVDDALQLKLSLRERCHAVSNRAVASYFVPVNDAQTVAAFAEKVDELLNGPEGHRGSIKRVAQACDSLLYAEHAVLSARESLQRANAGFVEGIDREIDYFQSKQQEGLDGAIDHYFSVARESMPGFARVLWRGLNPCLTPSKLLRLECFAESAELFYYRSLCKELLERQAQADHIFTFNCEAHWKTSRPRMQKALACDIGAFSAQQLESSLSDLRRTFMVQLYDAFLEQKLRFRFHELLRGRFAWLRGGFLCFCLLVVSAGILGSLNEEQWAFALLGAAAVVWLISSLAILRTSYSIRKSMLAATDELVVAMKSYLHEPMGDYIIRRVTCYRRMYVLPRQTLAKQSATLLPMQKEHSDIHRQLRALQPHL
ncbi:MAG: hypothetical protein R3Y56_05430 [Akkermansia sp.]